MSELIQEVPLFRNGTIEVIAELHKGFSVKFLECWRSAWVPALDEYLRQGKKKPEHAHWNWLKKATVAIISRTDELFFWITYQEMTQGIMLLDQKVAYFGQDMGKKNIYVSFLEVAPWNYYKDQFSGYYRGVGSLLLMTAINCSDELGFDGRIALESLPQSESFYLNHGMIPVEKPFGQNPLKYFELPTRTAKEVLKGMRK